ncbi:MAG: hypothetical protein ACC742_08105, partial [Thermoanaerobaculales bacterium]
MRNTKSRGIAVALAVVGVAIVYSGCSSSEPTDTPGVERLGEFILRQQGPELWTVLGYRFAASTLGDEWLILEVGLSSPNGQNSRVEREGVSVRTPSGETIPLATQAEFAEAYGVLRSTLRQADVNRDPLDYFPPNRIECGINFFAAPGEAIVFDQVTLNDQRGCYGRLFFKVPGGIQSGRWVFNIDLAE